jgi:hypothetical protein
MRAVHGDDAQPQAATRSQGELGLEAPVEAVYRFEGTGSIRGEIQVPQGMQLPPEFRVVAEPSRILHGREHAVYTERIYKQGEQGFEYEQGFGLRGLPLGGYDVRVVAPGLDCRPVPVLLCKGAEHPFVSVGLRASGFVDGSVIDERGRPVEDVLVTLEPAVAGERREVRTGPSGAYLIEDVPDGEYRLLVGPPHAPLAPPVELSFRAPSLNVPEQRIPALASFELATFDENWIPLADVSVSGYGSNGGQLELSTDLTGHAFARHLPPGTYKLVARHSSGQRGKLSIEIGLDEPAFVQFVLRP